MSPSEGIQGQIARQDDIQLLLKLIRPIYVSGDYSCILMHHLRELALKLIPSLLNYLEKVHVQWSRVGL